MDQSNSQLIGVLGLSGTCFPRKLPLPLRESSPPRKVLLLGPSPLIIPNGMSIGSAVFVWVLNAMLYDALSVRKKLPKIVPFPWDFVNLLEGDRATTIGNMHKNLVKIARLVPEISSRTDKQTHTHRHVHYNISQPLPGTRSNNNYAINE